MQNDQLLHAKRVKNNKIGSHKKYENSDVMIKLNVKLMLHGYHDVT